MANAHKGEVGFEALGQQYTLVLDFNALCDLEDEFGTTAAQLPEVIGNKIKNLRSVFRVGLSRNHSVSDLEAGNIIADIGLEEAGRLIGEAFNRSLGVDTKAKGNLTKAGRLAKA